MKVEILVTLPTTGSPVSIFHRGGKVIIETEMEMVVSMQSPQDVVSRPLTNAERQARYPEKVREANRLRMRKARGK